MNQSEKMIALCDVWLADIAQINDDVIARAKFPLAYSNLCNAIEKHFEKALLHWRCGENPVRDMQAALLTSHKMISSIADWQIDDETLNGCGGAWSLVSYISYFLDQPVEFPVDRALSVRVFRSKYADVALDYHVLDALGGKEWRTGIPERLERLAAKKRQMLAVETYRTYLDLLETDGRGERAEALVRTAEDNYEKRVRDSFYSGGQTYMGGGQSNRYVIDFQLASILKHIGYVGQTVHRWNW
jgi:hypothetical protein